MNILQIMFALIIGVMVITAFNGRNRQEAKLQTESLEPGRKTALVEPLMLPMILAAILVMLMIKDRFSLPVTIVAQSVLLFLYISIYYAALLLLLPLFRKIISARACATLWMVPTLLYFTMYLSGYETKPLLVISLPHQWLPVVAWIWAAGFAGVTIWQMISSLPEASLFIPK